jgi:hypothetical protein
MKKKEDIGEGKATTHPKAVFSGLRNRLLTGHFFMHTGSKGKKRENSGTLDYKINAACVLLD